MLSLVSKVIFHQSNNLNYKSFLIFLNFITIIDVLVELQNGETIFLRSFPSAKVPEFLKQAKESELIDDSLEIIHATGGGAYKYQDVFDKELAPIGVRMVKHDEMESLVNGMAFVLNCAKDPAFTFREGEGKKYVNSGL